MGKSPEGKLKSSFNSTSHGALSKRKLLPGEDAAELEACAAGWMATYAPQDYREQRLVDQLILNDWFLRRATHRLMELEASAGDGTENFEHRLGLMQRYKTAAERAFYRSVTAVESLRKDLRREERAEQKPEREIRLAEQWVEVRVDEKGKTVTTKHPPDEELRERVKALDPGRDLVYRRLNFVDGVPREYEWAMHDPAVRESGGAGVQRMRPEVWAEQIEREARVGKGHLLGCKSVPRPEERGGCQCPTCEGGRDG
jgi:hypothetical protein